MIAVDTNVVVRFLTRDDEAQFKTAFDRDFARDAAGLGRCRTVELK